GGEEFVLLLPGHTLEAAVMQAEKLRHAVVKEAFEHPASPLAPHVTISVGVAVMIPSAEFTPWQLVAAADQAMYDAKTSGRNKVACYSFAGSSTVVEDRRLAERRAPELDHVST
ncbi:MAG: GGDEF domain-containing protein, partial [Steroidobacter sp.]